MVLSAVMGTHTGPRRIPLVFRGRAWTKPYSFGPTGHSGQAFGSFGSKDYTVQRWVVKWSSRASLSPYWKHGSGTAEYVSLLAGPDNRRYKYGILVSDSTVGSRELKGKGVKYGLLKTDRSISVCHRGCLLQAFSGHSRNLQPNLVCVCTKHITPIITVSICTVQVQYITLRMRAMPSLERRVRMLICIHSAYLCGIIE